MTAVSCPRTFQCSGGLVSFDIGPIPSYVAIGSSSLSCLGSLLVLVAYCVLKDMRTGAQKIITLLAVADLFSALGYIAGSINFLVHFDKRDDDDCVIFQDLCDSQAIITSWSSLCSFAWTFILAFHFVMVIVFKRVALASKLIPVYNIIAWGGPLLIVVPLAVLGKFGYAPYAASNWCFVRDVDYTSSLKQDSETILIILLAGKLWEILIYISVTIFYIGIAVHISRSQRQLRDSPGAPKSGGIEKRLLAIPLLFILLRMWGTLQFFYSLAVSEQNHGGCIPSSVRSTFMVIGILQAVGDGGQGWGNAILYVLLSPKIRHKLFSEPCDKCLAETENRIAMFIESDTETNASEKSETKNGNGNGVAGNNGRRVAGDANEAPSAGATKTSGYKIRRYTSTTEVTAPLPSSDHESVQYTTDASTVV